MLQKKKNKYYYNKLKLRFIEKKLLKYFVHMIPVKKFLHKTMI